MHDVAAKIWKHNRLRSGNLKNRRTYFFKGSWLKKFSEDNNYATCGAAPQRLNRNAEMTGIMPATGIAKKTILSILDTKEGRMKVASYGSGLNGW